MKATRMEFVTAMCKTDTHARRSRTLFGSIVIAINVIPALAVAEGSVPEDAGMTLPPLVVTATRDARFLTEAPYAMSLLDAEALHFEHASRTVPEALKFEPSILVQKTAHGQGSPYIRGFTSQRNLFLIDGIRLNNSVFREGPNQYWSTVDPLGLSRIELARGPFAVLYGSDAIGGTVNAITRGAADLLPTSDWDRRLYYRYADAENAHVGRVETIGRAADKVTVTAGYSLKDFGDVEGGADVGTQPKTGYREIDWDAKIEVLLNDNAALALAHQCVDINDAWRTHTTIYGIDWKGLTRGEELRRVLDQDRKLSTLRYREVDRDGFVNEIHTGIAHHYQGERRDRLRTPDRHDVQGIDVNTLGAFLSLKSPSPAGTFLYGAELYHDDVDSFSRTLNPDGTVADAAIQGPVADDASYDTLGLYAQDELPLTERLALIVGARYEYAEADADSVEDPVSGGRISMADDWRNVVGSVRMQWMLNDARTAQAFAGVAQGFRAPNLSDLTRFDTARTDEFETPAPGLDPEHFIAYEAGVKAALPRLEAQLAYYYTDIEDMIVRTPTGHAIDGSREVTKRNAGDGYVQGVELDARCRLSRNLSLWGVLTWMEGKVDTYPTSAPVRVAEPIDRLMPPTGMAGLRWDAGDKAYWLEAACTIADRADKLSTRDVSDTSRIPAGGTPGYTVYDVRAGWRCTDLLTVSLAVENVTNEDYRIHGSGINEPGRNIVLATALVY